MPRRMAGLLERIARELAAYPRARKRAIMLTADAGCIPAALWTASALKHGSARLEGRAATPWLYLIALLTSVPIFVRLGLYRAVLRYMSSKAVVAVLFGVTASVFVLGLVNLALGDRGIAFTAIVVYWGRALVDVGGSRI